MNKQTLLLFSVALLFIGLSASTYWNGSQHQRQYSTYLQKTDWTIYAQRSVQPSSSENTNQQHIQKALQLAQQQDFTKAIGQLYPLAEAQPENATLQLHLGTMYLHNNHFQEAQYHLQQAYNQANAIEKLDAAWFLALLNIHDQQPETAKKYLQEVAQQRGNYHLEATELLNTI